MDSLFLATVLSLSRATPASRLALLETMAVTTFTLLLQLVKVAVFRSP
jgi:hypothetical protein